MEWFKKAWVLWDGKKYSNTDKAIEYLTQAIHLDTNYALAYNNRGLAYYKLKQIDHAMADYDQAINLDPKLASAFSNRGLAYNKINKTQEGCVDLEEACNLGLCEGYKVVRQQGLCK